MIRLQIDIEVPVALLHALEDRHMPMHPDGYRHLADTVIDALEAESLQTLIGVTRDGDPLLAAMAENVIFERTACLAAGTRRDRQIVDRVAESLMTRLLTSAAPR